MNLQVKKLNDSKLETISGGHGAVLPLEALVGGLAGMILGTVLGACFLTKLEELLFSNDKKTNKKESA